MNLMIRCLLRVQFKRFTKLSYFRCLCSIHIVYFLFIFVSIFKLEQLLWTTDNQWITISRFRRNATIKDHFIWMIVIGISNCVVDKRAQSLSIHIYRLSTMVLSQAPHIECTSRTLNVFLDLSFFQLPSNSLSLALALAFAPSVLPHSSVVPAHT